VPEGAYKMLPIREMRLNDNFLGKIISNAKYKGLQSEELGNKHKYLHFRPVQNQEKKDLIDREEAVFDFNFLDAMDEDKLKGRHYNYG